MTENETGEPKPESAPVEEEPRVGFRRRWMQLLEDGVEKRRLHERLTFEEFSGTQSSILVQAGIVALIETLFRGRKRKGKDVTKKEEATQ